MDKDIKNDLEELLSDLRKKDSRDHTRWHILDEIISIIIRSTQPEEE